MNRPYIICHMTTSIDGKVTGDFLSAPESEAAVEAYYEINRNYKADAYACGRVTMEGSFTGGFQPDLTVFVDAKVGREDYIADKEAKYFAVAFDRKGTCCLYSVHTFYDHFYFIQGFLQCFPLT